MDQKHLERFEILSAEAGDNIVVQLNFLTFFRQLAYGATEGGSFSRSGCLRLLENTELLRLIWRASTARPLNPRVAGSLRQHREQIAAHLGTDEPMPLPAWWQRLEESGFWAQSNEVGSRRLDTWDDDDDEPL
ncbi:hypothetical protein [Longimicrobium sp.]|uniref:hypothetical protein n=1 Tax=Longimicrobium sp. TaxID=2029185 RepID=UPI002EDB7330